MSELKDSPTTDKTIVSWVIDNTRFEQIYINGRLVKQHVNASTAADPQSSRETQGSGDKATA
jgi:hypothetical protein